MNVAPDQTIIVGLQIFLDHRLLSSIGQKIMMMVPPLPHFPLFYLYFRWYFLLKSGEKMDGWIMPLILLPFQEHLLQWIHVDCLVWGLFLSSFPTQKPMSVMPLPTFELFPNLNDLTMHSSEWTMKIKEDVSSFGSSFSFLYIYED